MITHHRIIIAVLLALFFWAVPCFASGSAKQIWAKGIEFGARGDLAKAKENFKKALEVNPDYGPAERHLKVVKDAEQQRINSEAAICYLKGVKLFIEENLDGAIVQLGKAIDTSPEFDIAYSTRALLLKRKGKYGKAIEDCNKAIEINPKSFAAYYHRADSYGSEDKIDKAISDYSKAIEVKPDYHLSYYKRGSLYNDKGKLPEAISDYTSAIQLKPNDIDYHYSRGIAYGDMGNFENAISDFTAVIEIIPNHGFALTYRGLAYSEIGQNEKACSDWAKACEMLICSDYEAAKKEGICK